MDARAKTLALLVVGTLLGLALTPASPLGARLYPPMETGQTPTGAQVPLLVVITVVEALAFGLGLAILVDGFGLLRAAAPAAPRVARAAHLALVWLLASWVPHDALHRHNGMDLAGLIRIEYAFHVTLIAAAVVVARFFFVTLEARAEASATGAR